MTTLGVSSCRPPCFWKGLLLFASAPVNLTGQQAPGDSPVSTSHVTRGLLGEQRHVTTSSSGDSNSGPHPWVLPK